MIQGGRCHNLKCKEWVWYDTNTKEITIPCQNCGNPFPVAEILERIRIDDEKYDQKHKKSKRDWK